MVDPQLVRVVWKPERPGDTKARTVELGSILRRHMAGEEDTATPATLLAVVAGRFPAKKEAQKLTLYTLCLTNVEADDPLEKIGKPLEEALAEEVNCIVVAGANSALVCSPEKRLLFSPPLRRRRFHRLLQHVPRREEPGLRKVARLLANSGERGAWAGCPTCVAVLTRSCSLARAQGPATTRLRAAQR